MSVNKKVLIVDDDKNILISLQLVLENEGYQVLTSDSATNALNIIQEQNPKVMFFDLHMPEMDGVELCRKVRKNHHMELIYAMTGYSSLYNLATCREAGFDDMFLKPFSIVKFREVVSQSFEKINRWVKEKDDSKD